MNLLKGFATGLMYSVLFAIGVVAVVFILYQFVPDVQTVVDRIIPYFNVTPDMLKVV